MKEIKVLITNPKHPHCDKVGYLTGKIILTAWGAEMAELRFRDENGGCFISKGDAKELADHQSGETRKIPPIEYL